MFASFPRVCFGGMFSGNDSGYASLQVQHSSYPRLRDPHCWKQHETTMSTALAVNLLDLHTQEALPRNTTRCSPFYIRRSPCAGTGPATLVLLLCRQPPSSPRAGWEQRRAASVRLAGTHAQPGVEGELDQRAGEGPLRRDGNDATPTRHVGRTKNGGVRTHSSRSRKEPREGCRLGTPVNQSLVYSDTWAWREQLVPETKRCWAPPLHLAFA